MPSARREAVRPPFLKVVSDPNLRNWAGDSSARSLSVISNKLGCFLAFFLRTGGIMLFDDYFWDHAPDMLDRPKAAIDAFMNTFTRRFKVTGVGYQIAIQKL